ncbi:MAG: hypothetical protein IJ366_10310 [Clostridia bacterium]|nr:hypothetical protein [Clostridia bacterium]
MTVADLYSEKYGRINEDRMVSELSKTRNRLNNENDGLFTENLEILLTDVEDCPNVEAYIEKRIEEVKGFYTDYIELQKLDEDDFEDVTAIFLSYADSRNELAKWALKQKELLVSECATRSIEKNAAVTVGHASSLSRNNEIVTALNSLFGGVRGDTDHMERIKTANKKLTEYVAKLTTNAKTRERLMEELKTYGN